MSRLSSQVPGHRAPSRTRPARGAGVAAAERHLQRHGGGCQRLHAELLRQLYRAREAERARLRRDLHDQVLNQVAVLRLTSAFTALAEDLADRAGAQPRVVLELSASNERCDPHIEQHLYCIIQQACTNALEHAQAQTLRISGIIGPAGLDIWIEDDGRGFDAGTGLQQLGELVARLHYGMMGMQERAALVNAILSTEAAPCLGTQIRLEWKAMP